MRDDDTIDLKPVDSSAEAYKFAQVVPRLSSPNSVRRIEPAHLLYVQKGESK